jgi:hypothetical protein
VTRVPRVPRRRAGVADDHLSSIAATRAGIARASSAASPVRASRASVARRLPTEWRAGAPVLPVDIVHGLHFGSVSRYTGATYPSARGTTEGQHLPPRPSDAPSPKQQDHGGARDRPSNERGTAASVAARYRARICVVRVSRLTESVRSIACLLPGRAPWCAAWWPPEPPQRRARQACACARVRRPVCASSRLRMLYCSAARAAGVSCVHERTRPRAPRVRTRRNHMNSRTLMRHYCSRHDPRRSFAARTAISPTSRARGARADVRAAPARGAVRRERRERE